jgi:uncharacterized protein YbjT (DUF2867 family)
MKITVTTPTGHIGGALTEKLLEAGAELTLIARSPDKVKHFIQRGAHVVSGSHSDIATVKSATEGAGALFWLTPGNYTAENQRAYYGSFGDIVAEVARVRPDLHIVHLSSTGAHHAKGTGFVLGLRDTEEKLNAATKRLTHLRPTFFMENMLFNLPTIASDGAIYSPNPPEVTIRPVATRDVAAIAAERLLGTGPSKPEVIHILGPEEISLAQIAKTISDAIGKPVNHIVVPADKLRQALIGMGMSADTANLFLELQDAGRKGLIVPPEGSSVRLGTTTFAEFARQVIAPAYRGRS